MRRFSLLDLYYLVGMFVSVTFVWYFVCSVCVFSCSVFSLSVCIVVLYIGSYFCLR